MMLGMWDEGMMLGVRDDPDTQRGEDVVML